MAGQVMFFGDVVTVGAVGLAAIKDKIKSNAAIGRISVFATNVAR